MKKGTWARLLTIATVMVLAVFGGMGAEAMAQAADVIQRLEALPGQPELSSEVEIVWNQVNFRTAPGGKVITRLQAGDVLTCIGETWYGDSMWYHARSAEYGEGYVEGTWAKPIWNGERFSQAAGNESFMTDNMLKHVLDTLQFQLDYGFIRITMNDEEGLFAYQVDRNRENYDISIVTPERKIELVLLMYQNGMICLDERYDILRGTEATASDKAEMAETILKNHYGTDDLWKIFLGVGVCYLHPSDWHSPEMGSQSDYAACAAVVQEFIRRNQ